MAMSYVPDYLRVIAEQTAAANAKKKQGVGSPVARYIPSYANPNSTTYKKVTAANRSAAPALQPVEQRGVYIPVGAYRKDGTPVSQASIDKAMAINEAIVPKKEVTTTPVQTTPAPVQTTPEPTPAPVQTTPEPPPAAAAPPPPAKPKPTPYNVYDDPFYQQALQAAQNIFNQQAISAAGARDYEKIATEGQLQARPGIAEDARRRLAGAYAARGMGGGAFGALYRSEAEANAREKAARTSLRNQIDELDRQYTAQFGTPGSDWLGTARGQEAQQNAIQQALQNRLAGLTTVG